MKHTWTHDELSADLKAHLEGNRAARLIWCDMQLGPSGSPRPDVYALPKSYSRFHPFAYEVKISRSDFQTDINAGKWQKYYAFASAVVFAVPDGLIKKTELPEGAGLIVRKEKVWRTVRAPRVNPLDNLPCEAWIKLVMDGVHRLAENRRDEGEYFVRQKAMKKALGSEIARLHSDLDGAKLRIRDEIRQHEQRLKYIREQHAREAEAVKAKGGFAEGRWTELCELFGVPPRSHTHVLQQKIREAMRAVDSEDRVADLLGVIGRAEQDLAAAKLRVLVNKEAAA